MSILLRASLLPGSFSLDGLKRFVAFLGLAEFNGTDIESSYKVKENVFMRRGKAVEKEFLEHFCIESFGNQSALKNMDLTHNGKKYPVLLSGTADAVIPNKETAAPILEYLRAHSKIDLSELEKVDSFVIEHKAVNSEESLLASPTFYAPQCNAYSLLFDMPTVLVVRFTEHWEALRVFNCPKTFEEDLSLLTSDFVAWLADFKGGKYPEVLSKALELQKQHAFANRDIEVLEETAKYIAKQDYFNGVFSQSFLENGGFGASIKLSEPTFASKATTAGLSYLLSLGNSEFVRKTSGSTRFSIKYKKP